LALAPSNAEPPCNELPYFDAAAAYRFPQSAALHVPGTAREYGVQDGIRGNSGLIEIQVVLVADHVLQDSATGTTYDIDQQDEVSKHVGRKVQVTGTPDPSGKLIHLQPSER